MGGFLAAKLFRLFIFFATYLFFVFLGILGRVELDGKQVTDWKIYPMQFEQELIEE